MKIAGGKSLPHSPVGLSLAVEKPNLLAWDGHGGMTLFNQAAEVVAETRFAGLLSASLSADGNHAVALNQDGTLRFLGGNLAVRREVHAGGPCTAVAIDKQGHNIAVGLQDRNIVFWNGNGQEGKRVQVPSPPASMAFATQHPWLAFASATGLAGCADTNGALRWREGVPHHLGPIAMAGATGAWYLPCRGGGLIRYGPLGAPHKLMRHVPRCRLAASSRDETILVVVADSPGELFLIRDPDQKPETLRVPATITCLAMDPLGTMIMAGLDDRRILWIRP